jgi:CheY-like chemotaxis protein
MPNVFSKPYVVLADDNVDAATTTCDFLQLHDIDARPFFGGQGAIAAIGKTMPDVVVLDIGMPQPDGYAICKTIRSMPNGGHIPIIALTAYSDPEHSERIKSMGFAVHLTKPCNLALLIATVSQLARRHVKQAVGSVRRHDSLTAQRLDVALVYQTMLGYAAAKDFLRSVAMPEMLADRVLNSSSYRSLF